MGWTARNEQVHRQPAFSAIVRLWMIDIRPAGNGAGTDRNYNPGIRHGLIRLHQSETHVFGNWSGDEQSVGMSGRSHELNAEPAEIVDDRTEHIDFDLTAVAPARADLP